LGNNVCGFVLFDFSGTYGPFHPEFATRETGCRTGIPVGYADDASLIIIDSWCQVELINQLAVIHIGHLQKVPPVKGFGILGYAEVSPQNPAGREE
jgi:hypothetical protein